MKTSQFSWWAAGWLSRGLGGRTAQFSKGDMDTHWVSIWPVYAIFPVIKVGKVYNLYAIFEGIQSQGGCQVKLSSWPAWRMIDLLAGSATWNGLLVASMWFWVIIDHVDSSVMVWLSQGSSVIKTSEKWLSVWPRERCICDPANTHLHDSMMKWLKPSIHTCSTWLTKGTRDKHDTCDWSLVDCDDACATGNVTSCANVKNVFIVNTTCKHEAKTLSMTWTWSQAWLWHQHAKTWVKWISKVSEILEGVCSRCNTWKHTGRTLASLFWFIGSIGPWSFWDY